MDCTCTVACCLFFEFIIRNLHGFIINTSSERADWSVSQEQRRHGKVRDDTARQMLANSLTIWPIQTQTETQAAKGTPTTHAAKAFNAHCSGSLQPARGYLCSRGGRHGRGAARRYQGPVGAGVRSIRSDRWRPSGERGPKLSAPPAPPR